MNSYKKQVSVEQTLSWKKVDTIIKNNKPIAWDMLCVWKALWTETKFFVRVWRDPKKPSRSIVDTHLSSISPINKPKVKDVLTPLFADFKNIPTEGHTTFKGGVTLESNVQHVIENLYDTSFFIEEETGLIGRVTIDIRGHLRFFRIKPYSNVNKAVSGSIHNSQKILSIHRKILLEHIQDWKI